MATYRRTVMAQRVFQDPLGKLFGSASRVRIIRLFLFNPRESFDTAGAAARAHVPSAEARRELRQLVESGLLRKGQGKRPRFSISQDFPFTELLRDMLLNTPLRGDDIQGRLRGVGPVKLAVLSGVFTGNFDDGIDILVVGDKVNERRLRAALRAFGSDIGTELRYSLLSTADFSYRLTISDRFLRDIFDYPHRIAFDKLDLGLK